MATVTGLTAARMLAIEAATIVSAAMNGTAHLILTKHDGSQVDAGSVPASFPAASTTVLGLVPLATNAQTLTGTDTTHAVTPASLASIPGNKVQTVSGIAETATSTSYPNGISIQDCAGWTPAGFGTVVTYNLNDFRNNQTFYSAAGGTDAVKSWIRSQDTADGGGGWTAWQQIVTMSSLVPSNDDLIQLKSGAWTNRSMAQLSADLIATSAFAATTAQKGIASLADSATTIAGTDAAHTVTPAGLAAYQNTLVFNVRNYGAKGDGTRIRNVTASTASAVVTFNAANFGAGDVGKLGVVYTDTAAGTITTIQSVQSATSITLAVPAGITVSGTTGYFLYGTDDSAAFTAAFTAAAAVAQVDTSVGPNQPQGLGMPVVLVPGGNQGSSYTIGNAITVPSGVQLDTHAMVVNLLADRYAPCITWNPYSSGRIIRLEAMFGTGVKLGSAAGVQADVHIQQLILWHVGKLVESTGLLRSQDSVVLLGYGFLIDMVWCKGGARGIYHNAGSDALINRAFIIGAHTGVYMTQSNQIKYNAIILDSCGEVGGGYSGIVLDNACSDIDFDVQSFIVTGLTRSLDNVVLIGNGSTNKSLFLRFRVAAQKTGGNVVNLAQAQDVECDVLASNNASNSSGGNNITNALVFGTVAGSFRCSAELTGSITPYTGSVPGIYRYCRSGVEYEVQAGGVPTGAAQTANGTSPAAITFTGNDARGKIFFGSGASPTAGNQVVVTFLSGTGWVGAPYIMLTPQNAATAALQPYVSASTATTFTIAFGVAPAASQAAGTYVLNYTAMG